MGSGYTYFLTLTAPGVNKHSRWIQGKRKGQRSVPCLCHDNAQTLAVWNGQESATWNRLRLALSRCVEGSLTYIGSVEVQERGALHRHLVLNADRPLFPEEVQALALQAGYGCTFDLQVITSASKAAWYISKYVAKSAGVRSEIPWMRDVVDRQTGEVRPMHTVPTFRSWSSAHSWGYTLKGLRDIARAQARARDHYLAELAQLLDEDQAGGLAPQSAGHVHMAGPPT